MQGVGVYEKQKKKCRLMCGYRTGELHQGTRPVEVRRQRFGRPGGRESSPAGSVTESPFRAVGPMQARWRTCHRAADPVAENPTGPPKRKEDPQAVFTIVDNTVICVRLLFLHQYESSAPKFRRKGPKFYGEFEFGTTLGPGPGIWPGPRSVPDRSFSSNSRRWGATQFLMPNSDSA